jgi:hypothetical protein
MAMVDHDTVPQEVFTITGRSDSEDASEAIIDMTGISHLPYGKWRMVNRVHGWVCTKKILTLTFKAKLCFVNITNMGRT